MNDSDGQAVLPGRLVRDRRQASGLTQRELARRAGVSLGTVRDLEQERTRRPQPGSLLALARVLKLSPEQIGLPHAGPAGGGPRLQILGPLTASRDGAPVPVNGAARRAVLGLLALSAGSPVHREAIIDVLWPDDPPANAVNLVQAQVSRLRGLLDQRHTTPGQGGLLVSAAAGYRLEPRSGQLDLLDFDRLAGGARVAGSRGNEGDACRLYQQALELWRGEPLADVGLLSGHPAVAGLSRRRAEVVVEYARAASAAGWHERVLRPLRELAAREPLNEQAHAQLMIALAGCGQQAGALTLYEKLRRRLDEDLGMPPGPELAAAHQRVLRQDIPVASAEQARVAVASGGARPSPVAEAGAVSRVVPRQLPVAPELFVGREAEMSELDQMLDSTVGTVVISAIGGTAGIGKTALAVRGAHQAAARFPDGQLYVNLRGFDPSGAPAAPGEVIRGFLDALGVPAERIPPSPDAQAGLYRSLLAGKQLLIVLDNAAGEHQVRPLLPGSPGTLVLVTSRNQLAGLAAREGARLLGLDLLTPAEASDLLTARLGTDRAAAEPGVVSDIIALCARLPLALAVAAARAAARPRLPLATLAAELRDAGGRLDALDAGDPAASVRAVFSWSYALLSPDAAGMFRWLGLHPGPDVSVPAAASLAGADESETRRSLTELTRAHLITEHSPGRYALHDLLRAYAAEQARVTDTDSDRRQAMHRVLDYYLHTAAPSARMVLASHELVVLAPPRTGAAPGQFADYGQALAWLEAEHLVLLAAINAAAESGFDTHAWQLPWAVGPFLQARGHYQEWAATHRTALTAATRLGDPAAQAMSARALAMACTVTGDHEQALSHFGSSLTLCRQLGNRLGEAKVHQGLCVLAERQGRYADALGHAENSLRLFQAIGNQAAEAAALNNVGWMHGLLGDYQQARAFCRQALTLNQAAGNRRHEGTLWDSVGYAEHHLGNFAEAVTCYQRAVSLSREVGDRYTEAKALTHLGDARYATGEFSQAREAWQESLPLLDLLHHPQAAEIRAKLRGEEANPPVAAAAT
jgi:DNA-binding SARP family transcriptional activator/tetratricopeptide (TPR) repeat protein/DNA-binding XRE family transcriptional regulator